VKKEKAKRLIGLDYGLSRIGLAISDEKQIIALPLTVFKADKKLEETAKQLALFFTQTAENYCCEMEKAIIGLPLMMNGVEGAQAVKVKEFITIFHHYSCIVVQPWDERLTTMQADRALKEFSLKRKARAKVVDKVSATLILQSYLDSQFPSL